MSDLSERVSALLDPAGDEQAMANLAADPVLRADPALVPAAVALYAKRAATAPPQDQVTMLVALRTICGQAIPVAVTSHFEPLLEQVPAPVAAAALLLIGKIQLAQDDEKGGLETLNRVVATGDDQAAPMAALLISSLLARSRPQDAERLARYVLATWPAFGPAAQVRLGYLLAAKGDLAGGIEAYQAAAASADAEAAPRAMASLGDLSRRAGRDDEAMAWYAKAIATGHPYQAERATVNLADLHLARGELDAAAELSSRVLDSKAQDLARSAAMIADRAARRRAETAKEQPVSGEAMNLLLRVVEIPTWYETCDFIQRHPEVLGTGRQGVLPALSLVIASWQEPQSGQDELDRDEIDRYRALLALLERCRERGVAAGFAELAPGSAAIPADLRLAALQLQESMQAAGEKYERDSLEAALRIPVHPAWATAPRSFREQTAIGAAQVLGWAAIDHQESLADLAMLASAAQALLPVLERSADRACQLIGPMLRIAVAAVGDDPAEAAAAAEEAASAAELLASERFSGLLVQVATLLSGYERTRHRPGLTRDSQVRLLRSAMAGAVQDQSAQAGIAVLLARALLTESAQADAAADRAEALALLDRALAGQGLGEIARIDTALLLASLLAESGENDERVEQLSAELTRIADSRPPGEEAATLALTGLSRLWLLRRHAEPGRPAAEAVALAERALAQAGPSSGVHLALGMALLAAYSEGGADLQVLRRADEMLELAWQALPDDAEVAMRRTDSAVLLAFHDGDFGPLQDVADRLRATIARAGPSYELLRSLGTALQNLGNHLRDRALVEEAVSVLTKVLDVVPASLRNPASHDLAGCLLSLMMLTDDAEGIDRVVELASASVRDEPADSPQRSSYLDMCAVAHYRRYQVSGDVADLSAAVDYGTQAASARDRDRSLHAVYLGHLATYLRERSELPGHDSDVAAASAAYREAAALQHASGVVLSQHESWLIWAGRRRAWPEAAEAADALLVTWDELRRAQTLEAHQQARLRADQLLAGSAAYAYAMAGRPADAALALERGRARQIAEAMEETRHDLAGLAAQGHADVVQRFRQATRALRHITADAGGAGLGDVVTTADIAGVRAELDAAIAAIRSTPGRERFLAEPALGDLHAAAAPAPLIYLALTTFGGIALVVTTQSVSAVPLAELHVDALLPGAGAFYVKDMLGEAAPDDSDVAAAVSWLGDAVMAPVLAALPPGTGQAVLIPTGLLAMLPLHAALLDARSGRCACDELCLTYAPSARVLLGARQRSGQIGQKASSVLIAAEPAPSAAEPLRHVPAEVEEVRASFDDVTLLRGEAATRTAILAGLGTADVVHLACHGRVETQNPLASHLITAGDERLTVADFMAADLAGVRLVVLSACQSALPDLVITEEALALPGAILQAGAQAAIGTLWEVNDLAAMLVVAKFYRLWRAGGLEPAQALRQAQIWLRDTSLAAKRAEFPGVAELSPPDDDLAAIWDQVNPYADPRYWAPYVYVGARQEATQ